MVDFAGAATERFGRYDVVCNIGIYQGPGSQELLTDTTEDQLLASYEADVIAPVVLTKRAVPSMAAQGRRTVINMSPSSVVVDPPGTVKSGGWSFAYVAAKAASTLSASIVNVDLSDRGIRAFTVEPSFVTYGDRLAVALPKYTPACSSRSTK